MVARKTEIGLSCIFIILLLSCLAFGYQVTIDGNTRNFNYKRPVTIQSSEVQGGPHDNFPMLFDTTDDDTLKADLKHVDYSGKVQRSDGYDIVFAEDDGQEILKHEKEKYVDTSGVYVGWVNVGSLPSGGKTIYLYYGSTDVDDQDVAYITGTNRSLVWDSNFVGVWHLGESSGNAEDSTSYGTNGVPSGGYTQGVSGKIGNAYQFARNTEGTVNMGDPVDGHLDFGSTDDFTIEFWLDLDYFYYYSPFIVSKRGGLSSSYRGYAALVYDDNDGIPWYDVSSDGPTFEVDGTTALLDTGFRHVVYVFDQDSDTNSTIYVDGGDDKSSTYGTIGSVGSLANSANFRLNGPSTPDYEDMFDGMLDEVRISKMARGADWIKTSFNSMSSPSAFYNIGGESTLVKLSHFRAASLDSAVLLEWVTETELDNEGFNLWRRVDKDGEYIRINPYFIPAQGEAGLGAEYSYTDYDVQNGTIYYYKLEDIDIYGKSTFHGPVSAIPNDLTPIWPPDWEVLPSDAFLFSWSSSGNYSFKVEISTHPSFSASETLSFPARGWTSDSSLWLSTREWKLVLSKAYQSGGKLFWRVRARSGDGRVICSDWKRFMIDF